MEDKFEIKKTFPVKPSEIYNGFLDSEIHTNMTGGTAIASMIENEDFSAWDGYISGKNIRLVQDKEITQTWRTSEFNENDADSELTILLNPINGGTELTLIHSNIPDGQANYKKGWEEHYFSPMLEYFK